MWNTELFLWNANNSNAYNDDYKTLQVFAKNVFGLDAFFFGENSILEGECMVSFAFMLEIHISKFSTIQDEYNDFVVTKFSTEYILIWDPHALHMLNFL